MKSRLLLSSLLVVMLLVSAVGSSMAQDDPPPGPILGAINIIVADTFITPADGGEETRLIEASIFDVGETLRTDEYGVALITWFYDGTESALGQASRLTLNSFSGDAANAFVIDMELHEGHLAGAVGSVAADIAEGGEWLIKTPAFTVRPLRGQFEINVGAEGETRLIVTEGRIEVLVGDEAPFPVDENQYLIGAPGVAAVLTTNGVTPNEALSDICVATTPVNLNVRLAPNEDSRRLGYAEAGQSLWVRAETEGGLWYQVFFTTAEDDEEGHNYGWIYGPAVETEGACDVLLRAALDGRMYGGFGVDEALGAAGESDPIE
ncbi:MAG: SH3 domain-containing protein [Anaerolineae bacterium]|nr:SH3 domain-containing protein [Anaerolineae bacterium]